MRELNSINEVVLHCTDTPWGREVDIKEVRAWHTRGNGWQDVGYHYLIKLDGTLQVGRALNCIGAHVKGHNARTIGVAYVGGRDRKGEAADTMTCEQEETFEHLFFALQLTLGRGLELTGHNDHSSKACPGFKVREKWPNL